MDTNTLLDISKTTPGEDVSWLENGWLAGTALDVDTRAGIIDWLIQVQQYIGLTDTCLHAAVANLDLALIRVDWDPHEIQLVALAALQTAAKLEEDVPPATSLLLPLAGDVYTAADLARVELELLMALDWSVRTTTAAVFLQFYADKAAKGRKSVFRLAKAILDFCLFQDWYGCKQPSYLASCCLAAANSLSGQPWCQELAQLTGSSFDDLAAGVRLCLMASAHTQSEGFEEKHPKSSTALKKQLRHGIQTIIKDLANDRADLLCA